MIFSLCATDYLTTKHKIKHKSCKNWSNNYTIHKLMQNCGISHFVTMNHRKGFQNLRWKFQPEWGHSRDKREEKPNLWRYVSTSPKTHHIRAKIMTNHWVVISQQEYKKERKENHNQRLWTLTEAQPFGWRKQRITWFNC